MTVAHWSTTPSSNATADPNISIPEGMAPSAVNDEMRDMMAEIRKWEAQKVYAEYTTYPGSLTTVIPTDNTIPQVTEGTQILSASITPSTTATKIRISVRGGFSSSAGAATLIGAVFVNGAANAIAAEAVAISSTGLVGTFALTTQHAPASTSAQTYTVRIGTNSGSISIAPNPQYLGAVNRWTLELEEVI